MISTLACIPSVDEEDSRHRRPSPSGLLYVVGVVVLSACHGNATQWYTISRGDTGTEVSQRLELPFSELQRLNQGVRWRELQAGQRIRIPSLGGRGFFESVALYRVEPGDTGVEIARRLGVPFRELVRLNSEARWHRLQPGALVVYPSKSKNLSSYESPDRSLEVFERGRSARLDTTTALEQVRSWLRRGITSKEISVPEADDIVERPPVAIGSLSEDELPAFQAFPVPDEVTHDVE